jgi:hypothetical protein
MAWTQQLGSTVTNASGSLTILGVPTVSLGFTASPSSLTLTWSQGLLYQATNVTGPWTPVSGATSPYTTAVNPTAPQIFYRVRVLQ